MWRLGLALVLVAGIGGAGARAAPATPRPFVPTAQYEKQAVEGWTVMVNRRLLREESDLGKPALKLLAAKLAEAVRVMPATALPALQRVPIWLGVDDGSSPCSEYHPSANWLRENGFNPDKARAIEIGNARRFVAWSRNQPALVMHELAHAYHDQVLGTDRREIREAFAAAQASGKYQKVLRANGKRERSYALTTIEEYFAEGSEAFFGTNDFFPFVEAELREFDPALAAALQTVWNLPVSTAPVDPKTWPTVALKGYTGEAALPASADSERATSLALVNATPVELAIFWIDWQRKRQPYGRLRPGETKVQQTYEGHTFLLAAGERGVALVVAPKESGRAVVTPQFLPAAR